MITFQNEENVMKNQDQANNNNNLNDPTVANDPQAQVEFDDLPMPGVQEEQVKGGTASPAFFKNCCAGTHYQMGPLDGVKIAS
jgi:hypothetical protein